MKSAIISTGGKQYLVQEGQSLSVEKINKKAGTQVMFSDVLLTATDKTIKVGSPLIKSASVVGKIIKQTRFPKVTGVKMKAKKRQRHLFGHRQAASIIEITKIKTS